MLSLFNQEFISDSYASRVNKGQYKAINTFRYFIKLVNNENHGQCFVLKGDVKKYFNSINHDVLLSLIRKRVICDRIFNIIQIIINSFVLVLGANIGIPLGNVTSQIFANIYLNVLDQYVKKALRCRFYLRYNDDFVIISDDENKLIEIRKNIVAFVKEKLHLEIPFDKTEIRKVRWGIDFLGFTILPKAILLRNKTKNKIYLNIRVKSVHSYFSILKHCNSFGLRSKILSLMQSSQSMEDFV